MTQTHNSPQSIHTHTHKINSKHGIKIEFVIHLGLYDSAGISIRASHKIIHWSNEMESDEETHFIVYDIDKCRKNYFYIYNGDQFSCDLSCARPLPNHIYSVYVSRRMHNDQLKRLKQCVTIYLETNEIFMLRTERHHDYEMDLIQIFCVRELEAAFLQIFS